MASVADVKLTITQIPNSANVAINVKYTLAGDAIDVAAQTPYREVCQIIGDDRLEDRINDVLFTIVRREVYFPDPDTSNPILKRNVNAIVPLAALDEDNEKPYIEADEIRAKVTLTQVGNFKLSDSNLVSIGGLVPPLP